MKFFPPKCYNNVPTLTIPTMTFNYYIEKYDIIFIKMIIYLSNSFIPFPFPLLLLCTSMCINFDKTFSIHPTLYISHIFYHFQYSIYTCSSIFFCVELFSFIWRLAFNISCSQSHCWWGRLAFNISCSQSHCWWVL